MTQAQKEHYERNKARYIKQAHEKHLFLRRYVDDHKRGRPCQDCNGVFPPVCMDFDHRPDEEKFRDVAALCKYGSLRRIQEEIAKCDLVCSNCHRLRTVARLGSEKRAKSGGDQALSA